ncbi:MAG: DUF1934 domain-containing protein [Bacillota bacterium]
MEIKKVSIIMRSHQHDADDRSGPGINFFTMGEYYKDDNKHVIKYDESEVSGLEGTRTTLMVDGDGIILERHGNHRMCQIFRVSQKEYTTYNTPYGDLLVEIIPTQVESSWSSEGGQINLAYFISIGGQELGEHKMSINISPAVG